MSLDCRRKPVYLEQTCVDIIQSVLDCYTEHHTEKPLWLYFGCQGVWVVGL